MKRYIMLALVVAGAGPAAAQQARPERYEIRVTPSGEMLDFRAEGAWRMRARAVSAQRAQARRAGEVSAAIAGAGAATSAVTGTMRVPAVFFRYQDVGAGAAYDTTLYRSILFDPVAPPGVPYSLRSYYAELSNGLLDYIGDVFGWVTLDSGEVTYTGVPGTCTGSPFGTTNCNGLFSADASNRRRAGLREALAKVDGSVDFGLYDNDGPDGTPNSGDDDGVVDFVLFVQSEGGGECGGATNNHIWSHRSSGLGFVTNDARFGGGSIVASDYIIQPGVGGSGGCDFSAVMPIGTTAHESGHAFNLPDLYDISQVSEGIGRWGLMGSGSWSTQASPARMSPWSLDQLGWVTLAPVAASGTLTLGTAPSSDSAFIITVPGNNPRNEYFLIENRQGVGADTAMVRRACDASGLSFPATCAGGLAIWHIDGTRLASGGGVNTGTIHGVALVQADGLNQLRTSGGNRGDGGDLYPGINGNTAFTPQSSPAAVKNADGTFVGFQIDSIRQVAPGGEMSFRVSFGMPLDVVVFGAGVVVTDLGDTLGSVTTDIGDTVTVIALPDPGNAFEGWAGDATGTSDTIQLVMDRSRVVSARFAALLALSDTVAPDGVMGAPYAHTFASTGGIGPATWTILSGALPAGLAMSGAGAISGTPEETGSFNVTVRATSGTQAATFDITLEVTAPALTPMSVVGDLVGTAPGALAVDERTYLDLLGNRNGSLDVGDFLAWVQATGATVSAEAMAQVLREGGAR